MWAAVGRKKGSTSEEIQRTAEQFSAAVLVPVCGDAVQKPGTFGFDPDGFMLQMGTFHFLARKDLDCATVTGWLPEYHGGDVEVTVGCESHSVKQSCPAGKQFSIELALELRKETEHDFRIALSSSYQPSALPGGSADSRNLGCIIHAVDFRGRATADSNSS